MSSFLHKWALRPMTLTAAAVLAAACGGGGGEDAAVVAPAPAPAPASSSWNVTQSSDKAQRWGFDFVEEFDGLQDWNQSTCVWYGNDCGNRYDDRFPELMPRLADGRKGPWGYFSIWNRVASSQPWIGPASGDRKVWRGSKSLTIDIGATNQGPSRFGLYFANGGYRDFRVFYMLWIPKNMFPTSCEGTEGRCAGGGPTGIYTEGQPYRYFASWKFNTFNMGCGTVNCPAVSNSSYGLHSTIPQIRQYNYQPNGLVINNSNDGGQFAYAIDDGRTTLNAFMDGWWGVEFHIRNIDNNTRYLMDIWVYDRHGQPAHVMQSKPFPITAAAQGHLWDEFFFGGNNANSWIWGPTMRSHYFVDDFIVDAGAKGPIGPRYFQAIGTP